MALADILKRAAGVMLPKVPMPQSVASARTPPFLPPRSATYDDRDFAIYGDEDPYSAYGISVPQDDDTEIRRSGPGVGIQTRTPVPTAGMIERPHGRRYVDAIESLRRTHDEHKVGPFRKVAGIAAQVYGLKPIAERLLHPGEEDQRRSLEMLGGLAKAEGDMLSSDARINAEAQRAEMYRSRASQKPGAQAIGQFGWYDRENNWHDAPSKPPAFERPVVLPPGATAHNPATGALIATGSPKPAAPTLETQIAEREKAADRLGLKGRDRQVYVATGRMDRPPSTGGPAQPNSGDSAIADSVIAGTVKLKDLTPTVRTRIAPILQQKGYQPPEDEGGLSAADAKIAAIANTLLPELDELKTKFSGDYKKALAGYVTGVDRGMVKLVDNIADKIGRLRSGGAVNRQEEERFKRQLGGWGDLFAGKPEEASKAIDGLISEATAVRGAMKPAARKVTQPAQTAKAPAGAPYVGAVLTKKDGSKHRVTKVHPDGSFEAEPVK